jgi:hypothetical protein
MQTLLARCVNTNYGGVKSVVSVRLRPMIAFGALGTYLFVYKGIRHLIRAHGLWRKPKNKRANKHKKN